MTRDVIVAPEAERQIRAVDAGWRDKRPAAPDLFEQEFRDAVATLATHASIGRRVTHPDVRGLRRSLLRHTRYHVYDVATEHRVLVHAVWSAVRGSGPDLAVWFPAT